MDETEVKYITLYFVVSEMKVGPYHPVMVAPAKPLTVAVHLPLTEKYVENANTFDGDPVLTLDGVRKCYNELQNVAQIDERKPTSKPTNNNSDDENDETW